MKKNVGGIDKKARMIIGALLVLVGTVGIQSIVVTIVGLVVMGTGVFGFCGLYSLLGINTACKIAPKDGEKKEGE
ncbi:MAG: DUF2892 domain-containing protein [Campylobacterales bacterium]